MAKNTQNKTQPTEASIEDFLNKIESDSKREDAFKIHKMMQEYSSKKGRMWGSSIIGYGVYHYKYESGREGDFLRIGFSPRKTSFSLYIMSGFSHYDNLLAKLGKHKTGKSCLYINKLDDVNLDVLKQLMQESLKYMEEKYGKDESA